VKKRHLQRVENGNWLNLSSKLRRKFGSVPTSFTNSATEKMGAILTIGLKLNRR